MIAVTDWDTTPRDRAVTRGLLMGLSRRRGSFFTTKIPTEIVLSIVTLGLRPLWVANVRVDRWRRYEWLLLGTFATWWHDRTDDANARRLTEDADRFSAPTGVDRPVIFAVVGGLALLWMAARDGGLVGALDCAFRPQSGSRYAFAYSAILSIAWLVVLARGWQQHARANAWIAELNDVLAADGRRPVPATDTRVPWIWFALAFLIALVGPTWGAMMVAVLAIQNDLSLSLRPVRLRMVERVLERMDASGLPIEYDVEANAPETFTMATV